MQALLRGASCGPSALKPTSSSSSSSIATRVVVVASHHRRAPAFPSASPRSSRRGGRTPVARAAEEEGAAAAVTQEEQGQGAAAADGSGDEQAEQHQQEEREEQQQQQEDDTVPVEMSALDRAREAIRMDAPDMELLEASLAELEEEAGALRDSVTAAESRAAMLEGTLQAAKDQLLRLTADFDNFRRRSAGEKDAIAIKVKSDVVAELLPLVDNFELARTQVKVESEGENKINSSYQSLYKQMVDIMRGFGIDAVPAVGSEFDPEIHEAIMREPSDEFGEGIVSLEFRKGFTIGDKLIRPAMVKVSMGPGPEASQEPATEEPAAAEAPEETA